MSLLDTHGTAASTFRKHSLVGCYSNNLTESSKTQLNDPTSHKSEFMHGFDFLFQTSRKDVTESAAAGVDKPQSNFPEGCPFFHYLSEAVSAPNSNVSQTMIPFQCLKEGTH